ncbi:hypothetical protein ACFQL9_13030 [Halobaculum lipolyticum]|uniref:Major facilitator superfamily (MFS) profile domain-containing protein n=1 Tax=Halobaculum lipolyticum TaxID=3032001 RepID=A0ABD5WG91_9EURY
MSGEEDSASLVSTGKAYIIGSEDVGTGDAEGTFGAVVIQTLAGIVFFVGTAVTAMGQAIVFAVTNPLEMLGIGSGDIIASITSAPAEFLTGLFGTAGETASQGVWRQLGIFLPVAGAVVMVLTLAVVLWWMNRRDSDLPALGVDLPVIGESTETEAEDDEEVL